MSSFIFFFLLDGKFVSVGEMMEFIFYWDKDDGDDL